MRKAIVGDKQSLTMDFNGAKAGEVYHVRVEVEKPDGTVEARYIDYEFYEPVSRKEENKERV